MTGNSRQSSSHEQAIRKFLKDYSNRQNGIFDIQDVLQKVCEYYESDRSFVFELNSDGSAVSNTYEYCKDGISPEMSNLSSIELCVCDREIKELEDKGEMYVEFSSDKSALSSTFLTLLANNGYESLMAVPLIVNGKMRGFTGVDNPRAFSDSFLFLSVISTVLCNDYIQKEMEKTNLELIKLLESEKQHTSIINSLSNVYFSLCYIDLETNTFREMLSPDGVYYPGDVKDLRSYLAYWINENVSEEYRSEMYVFTDMDTIDERLGAHNNIIQEYTDTNRNWIRCSLFPAKRDESGKNLKVIMGFRDITEQKEQMNSQDELVRALAMSYENVYSVNIDTSKTICYRMNENMKSNYGVRFAVGDYETNMRVYLENEVIPEDRHLFSDMLDIDSVKKLFSERQFHIITYRVLRNQRIQYFKCQLVKPDAKSNLFVMGFKSVDEERKKEAEQQKKVEDALLAVEKINTTLRNEMLIAGMLSRDYPDVMLLDFFSDTAVTIKRNGEIIEEEKRIARRSYYSTWDYYIARYVYEEDREALRKAIKTENVKKALKKGDEYTCSYRVYTESMGMHYYQASFFRFYSGQNKDSQVILGFRCIDAIVEEEHKNRRIQDEQLRIIGALSQEYSSLFKIDARTRIMTLYRTDAVSFDPAVLGRLLSLGDYELILSKYIDAFVVPEDRDRIREAVSLSVLEEKVPNVGLYKLGYRRIMNGVISYYEMNMVKTVDNNGTVIFILGLRDVDEESRRQLKQTREMEAQREIIEGLGSEYYSVLLVNPTTDHVTVFRKESDDGISIAMHFDKNDYCWSKGLYSYCEENVTEEYHDEFMEKLSLEHIRSDGEDYSFTYEKRTSDGTMYLQARVAFVMEKNGGCVAVIGTRNVDDLIRRERQQEMALQAACEAAEAASKAKTEFLSNMSHDIRTPMNGIIGMTAIAGTHLDDKERVRDCLQKISQASKHMLSLINEVLDMSKIESGKVDLIEEEFNLSNLIDNLLSMTNEQIAKHHHELSVNISGVIHEEVIGDSLRIQKVFTNLMSNAVKYTPDGGKIRLTIRENPSPYSKVGCFEFIFEDNGIGMSEEYLSQIFDPFSRSSDNRVNKIQGTGLGMPISRNIVRMMGGDIKVESKLNIGSRFTVTIYLKLQEENNVKNDKFIDLNVLVADDDVYSLESCVSMLSDLGMKPDGVSSGVAAVERVVDRHKKGNDYFACIIDWKMPGMDGLETTRTIRQQVGRDVPIIIISAYDWSDIEQDARAAGADAFISKPLFRSRLEKTFGSLIGEAEFENEENPFVELARMDLSKKRILLVEDNDLNAEIASEILGVTGVKIERASDGKMAVDMMAACVEGYYDLIFMDIQMPYMNGYDATRAIRAMDGSYCKQIPIIAMTANAFAEDVQAAKTVGMNEHIAKPLDLKALSRTMSKWLK